jgi:B12-binding domain/radical SAM domain protein of rhizo-twelve system
MRVALVNPPWSFEGSIYFGCREPHLPLELGYARQLLAAAGHTVRLFDGHLGGASLAATAQAVVEYAPELTVLTTAPSYLFWRCAPPELRVPRQMVAALRRRGLQGPLVAVGPHGSATPGAAMRKLDAQAVVMGECEQVLVEIAACPPGAWAELSGVAVPPGRGAPPAMRRLAAADMAALPALRWEPAEIAAHRHHHHRFEAPHAGPGAELEATRGCPYHCTFCAKDNFRNAFRRRPLEVILDEIDGLLASGVTYVYFIDEIFVPNRPLLEALVDRHRRHGLRYGVQLRIDNWNASELELLGRSGCVSIEAGIESISREGRERLAKRCKLTTEELTGLLKLAKRWVPFVQANLLDAASDPPEAVQAWRAELQQAGVWANEPVPLFPYPGSPGYTAAWGPADDGAWERAHARYLEDFRAFSDLQAAMPRPLAELEAEVAGEGNP